MSETTTDHNRFQIDKRLVQGSFNRAAAHYDEIAVLQFEVGDRMMQRLDLVKINPDRIADIGAGTGRYTEQLAARYSKATVLALDIAPAMLAEGRRRASLLSRWLRKKHYICADAELLPVADASIDLIFSNLTLQWCNDLDRAFGEFRRVLRPGGLLMFTTLGPDTLKELRHSWSGSDPFNHVNAFFDMHDVGDALVRARFETPVMDVEHFTLTYPDVMQLMRDLKALGGHNVTAGRPRGMTGRRRLKAVADNYEKYRRDGLLPATYEVVYGHAWAPLTAPGRPQAPGVATIAVSDIGRKGQR